MYNTELINEAMGKKRLTNEALAELSNVSVATVSYVRNGRTEIKLETLKKIADALELRLSDLFTQPVAA